MLSTFSLLANLVIATSLLVAFHYLQADLGDSAQFLIEEIVAIAKSADLDGGALVVFAIVALVALNNLAGQIENRLLKAELVDRARVLPIVVEKRERQRQSRYLSTLRPMLGQLFSLAIELPKLMIFSLAILTLNRPDGTLWIFAGLATLLGLGLFQFRRGKTVYYSHRRTRDNDLSTSEEFVKSLIQVENNSNLLPTWALLSVMMISLVPFVTNELLFGDLLKDGGIFMPVWLLFISSMLQILRLMAALGLSQERSKDSVIRKAGD